MNIQTFNYSLQIDDSLVWQYNEATALQTLIEGKQNWYNLNVSQFWENWYNDVFNLATANEFGLSVWSIILNLPLFLIPDSDEGHLIWGYGQYRKNYNNGNFKASNSPIILTIEEQRLVLQLRYFQLTTRGSAPDVNAFYKIVFEPFGTVYMLDTLLMKIKYIFLFTPSANLLRAFQEYDLLARSQGVGIKYWFSNRATWGFGPFRKNYNNGNFGD